MNVATTKCNTRHGRVWKALWAIVVVLLAFLTLSLLAVERSYDAKAEAKDAAAQTERLKVEVDAHEVQATEERGVVRGSLQRIEDDVKTLLRNGKGK